MEKVVKFTLEKQIQHILTGIENQGPGLVLKLKNKIPVQILVLKIRPNWA